MRAKTVTDFGYVMNRNVTDFTLILGATLKGFGSRAWEDVYMSVPSGSL